MADLKTNLLGFVMNSPVIGASGTVGYGVEYEELADFSKIGGISGKGLTLHGQYGNKGERLWETPSGLINSIGLQNPGVQHFIDVELNEMLELKQKYGTVAIANLGGHSEEEYVEGAALLSESAVDIVELNISCPNVKVGGMAYGCLLYTSGGAGVADHGGLAEHDAHAVVDEQALADLRAGVDLDAGLVPAPLADLSLIHI